MEIVHVYQKKRSDFGRQCKFSDRHAKLIVDIDPQPSAMEDYIYRNPADAAIQCASEFSEHEVNTERKEFSERGMNHIEGGWPKDVDPTEVEQVLRFRKKVEKDEHFQQSVAHMGQAMEHCIKQNNALDIYEDYFPSRSIVADVEAPSARVVNVFQDPQALKRSANCISWNPDGARKLAVAYSILDFQKAPAGISYDSYIWDRERPNEPDMTLSPSSPLVTIQYNPKDVHTILGGCYNGQIAIWDTRKGSRPYDTTPIEVCHRDPVHGLCYMSSKTGTEFFTTSTDGRIMWWDTRKLAEPTEVLDLETGGGITADFESTMPTRFMIGTEQGLVINGNRKGKTPAEKLATTYEAHFGPVYSVKRNPFFPKYFLTVGDWTSRIWCEDVRESAILSSKNFHCYVTTSAWSYARPAVAFTGRSDGAVDIWDFLFKQSAPALTHQVSDGPINSIASCEATSSIACGAYNGSVTILELSNGLVTMQGANEKSAMSSLLERETSREKILASRMRELALQQRIKSAKPAQEQGGHDDEEDPVAAAEKNFWSTIDPEYYEKQATSEAPQENGTSSD